MALRRTSARSTNSRREVGHVRLSAGADHELASNDMVTVTVWPAPPHHARLSSHRSLRSITVTLA